MKLAKFSMGIGDRFGQQGAAQLSAIIAAAEEGIEVTPVWNKSNREHEIIKTAPPSVRAEADAAARALGWNKAYYVDADHINLGTVDSFIDTADFFTLDVADFCGQAAAPAAVAAFVEKCQKFAGEIALPGCNAVIDLDAATITATAEKYLLAVLEAGKIYRHIAARKQGAFITEVSMDETDLAQTPEELFVILAAIAFEGIPAQTIAPKFTGRFNKGVDYTADTKKFAAEFRLDVAVIAKAVELFGLPANLKLSLHSGSDKFALYGPIKKILSETGAGIHVKTAGTTWLEEIIGLAASGAGLPMAKEIYRLAYERQAELCAPYATVIDINPANLPQPATVAKWGAAEFAAAVRHDAGCPTYNPHMRQLLHVGYKVAAEMPEKYFAALAANQTSVAAAVKENLLARHLRQIFPAAPK